MYAHYFNFLLFNVVISIRGIILIITRFIIYIYYIYIYVIFFFILFFIIILSLVYYLF